MAHFNFSQNAKWGHAGFYIDCHRMTVPENILLQKSTVQNKQSVSYSLPARSRSAQPHLGLGVVVPGKN